MASISYAPAAAERVVQQSCPEELRMYNAVQQTALETGASVAVDGSMPIVTGPSRHAFLSAVFECIHPDDLQRLDEWATFNLDERPYPVLSAAILRPHPTEAGKWAPSALLFVRTGNAERGIAPLAALVLADGRRAIDRRYEHVAKRHRPKSMRKDAASEPRGVLFVSDEGPYASVTVKDPHGVRDIQVQHRGGTTYTISRPTPKGKELRDAGEGYEREELTILYNEAPSVARKILHAGSSAVKAVVGRIGQAGTRYWWE